MSSRKNGPHLKEVDLQDPAAEPEIERILDEAEALDAVAELSDSRESGMPADEAKAEEWRKEVAAYMELAADAAVRTVDSDGEGA